MSDSVEIESWLKSDTLSYGHYWQRFVDVGYDRWDILFQLSKEKLVKVAKVKEGHAMRIYRLLHEMKIRTNRIEKEEEKKDQKEVSIVTEIKNSIINSRQTFVGNIHRNASQFLAKLPVENLQFDSNSMVVDILSENECMSDSVNHAIQTMKTTIINDMNVFRNKLAQIKVQHKSHLSQFSNHNIIIHENESHMSLQSSQPKKKKRKIMRNMRKKITHCTYTDEQNNFLHEIYLENIGLTITQIKDEFNVKFNQNRTISAIAARMSRIENHGRIDANPMFYSSEQMQYMTEFIKKCGGKDTLTVENIIELSNEMKAKFSYNRSARRIATKLYKHQLILCNTRTLVFKNAETGDDYHKLKQFTKKQTKWLQNFIDVSTPDNSVITNKFNEKFNANRIKKAITNKLYSMRKKHLKEIYSGSEYFSDGSSAENSERNSSSQRNINDYIIIEDKDHDSIQDYNPSIQNVHQICNSGMSAPISISRKRSQSVFLQELRL